MMLKKLKNVYDDLRTISYGNYSDVKKYRKNSIFYTKLAQYKKMFNSTRMKIARGVKLTAEEKRALNSLFSSALNKRVSTLWHRYYQGISGKFDSRYIPEILYAEMEFLLNDHDFASALSDKMVQHHYFSAVDNVKVPTVYAFVRNGIWYSHKMEKISLEQVTKIFCEAGSVFAKPISDSCSGMGCQLLRFDAGKELVTGIDALDYVARFEDNYMFEEVLVCSDDIRALHPSSVNTFRVMTYMLGSNIFTCPTVMRIGRNNNLVDNAHAGGLAVAVRDDGVIVSDNAVTEFGAEGEIHPNTNIRFRGYKIRNFDKVLKAATSLHKVIPQLKIVSWDITLDKNEEPVFIEVNTFNQGSWLPQMAHGVGMFGDNTEAMLEVFAEKRKALL